MGKTPNPKGGENVDTMTYPIPSRSKTFGGGTANAQTGNIPTLIVNGHSTGAPLPALTGEFSIGENKNVSTPVTGS